MEVGYLREALEYDPQTGLLFWKVGRKAGQEAGWLNSGVGYRYLKIRGHEFRSHRVAWAIYYGSWPEKLIDHVNGNSVDNRIDNLREATSAENAYNGKRHKDNVSGYKGVTYLKRQNSYHARIWDGVRSISLGCYKTPLEAHQAYQRAATELFGEFARFA